MPPNTTIVMPLSESAADGVRPWLRIQSACAIVHSMGGMDPFDDLLRGVRSEDAELGVEELTPGRPSPAARP
ncbi:hypothetical protein GCM10020001_040590 [Nonomuraea salmonea]